MTRKMSPITVWKRLRDGVDVRRVVVDDDEDERAQPRSLEPVEPADHGDHEHVDGRAEADRRRRDLRVPPDEEDPGDRRDEAGEDEGQRAVQRDVVAQRAHAHGVVADALQRQAERRARDVAQGHVDQRGHRQRHEVQAIGMRGAAEEVGDRDPADAAEARHDRDLAEEQVRDHGEDQRDHQEVDAVAAAGQRAEDDRHHERHCQRDHDAGDLRPPEVQALRVAVGGQVAQREARHAVDGRLRQRHHPAVRRQEDQARGHDAEEQHLGQQRRDPVLGEDQRREQREQDQHRPCDPVRGEPRAARCVHAGRPKSPRGRTASTMASRTKVKMIE